MRLFAKALFGAIDIQRDQPLAAATLGRVRMPVLVHEEMPERDQEERAEFAALRPGATWKAIRQQMGEEILRQILSILGASALSTDESIERIPIAPAKLLQGLSGCRRAGLACRPEHHAPVGGGEYAPVRLGLGIRYFRPHACI